MIQRFEGHFTGADKNDLFFQTWTPEKDKVRGSFLITHGLGEHSECYHSLGKILAEDGWQVFAWDMRGHGRSEGKRGFALSLDNFVGDLKAFLVYLHNSQQEQFKTEHLVLFGHSLGGLVTLRTIETLQPECAAVVCSSPALGLSVPVPAAKEAIAKFAVNWFPTITMWNEIRYTDLTRDPEMIASYQRDNLRHDKISPGVFLGMKNNFPLALAEAGQIEKPVLFQLAGNDKVASTPAAMELFARLPHRKNQMIVYPESYHEIYMDLDRDKAIADLKKFIHPYLGE